jgi:hypothetical protein
MTSICVNLYFNSGAGVRVLYIFPNMASVDILHEKCGKIAEKSEKK